jgi:Gpi18-like mannosyltransferase
LLPIKNNILFGQTYFLILVLLIEAYILLEKKESFKAGFFISLAICLKVFPIFLIPYFVWLQLTRKRAHIQLTDKFIQD